MHDAWCVVRGAWYGPRRWLQCPPDGLLLTHHSSLITRLGSTFMRKGLVGVAVGAAAAIGGAWAVKKLLGSGDSGDEQYAGADGATMGTDTPAPRREGLDPVLLEILACPDDKQPV